MPSVSRLTLSWVGKDQALIETAEGSYEWVERHDPRVTEVRLLYETDTVGEISEISPRDNLLIAGDSYDALRALAHIPEFAERYRGKINKYISTRRSTQDRRSQLMTTRWSTRSGSL